MTPSPTRDLIVGLFVAVSLAAVAWLSLGVGGVRYGERTGLILEAAFDDIGGLKVRAPVVISGVKVGQVKSIRLDDMLRARVELDLDPDLEIPEDTFAAIRTAGLLGDQFIALEPGAEEDLLVTGDVLSFTESALNIEKLVGALVHGSDIGGE